MERDSYSVEEFCQRHGFCRATFYKLVKRGEGPRLMQVGQRVMISREAAADWRYENERRPAKPLTGAAALNVAKAAASDPAA